MRQTVIEDFCTDIIECKGTLKEPKDDNSNTESNSIRVLGNNGEIQHNNSTISNKGVLPFMEMWV